MTHARTNKGWRLCLLVIGGTIILSTSARANPKAAAPEVEGSFHGFPVLRTREGVKLADGEFTQWIEEKRLYIRNTYDFGGRHRIEESAEFRLEPLVQEQWSWREIADEKILREYSVDLKSGDAAASKWKDGKLEQWRHRVDVEPGRTFAGIGFTVALRNLRDRLLQGETIKLRAIGFTPKPRAVTVDVFHDGIDRMVMGGRSLDGDRFVIRPRIPAIAKIIVKVSDTRIWLTHPWPAGFLRWEGSQAEPSDPVVRVDLLPGEPSGPAQTRTAKGI